jgi:hypothetical protein
MNTKPTIDSLRDDAAKISFINDYARQHPELARSDIDLALVDGLREVAPSESLEDLRAAMDKRLGVQGPE